MNISTSASNCQTGRAGLTYCHRCLWRRCDEPCFTTKEKLLQHMLSKHVSGKLICPYGCQYLYHLVRLMTNRLS